MSRAPAVYLAALVVAVSLVASGWALKDRFDRGAKTRVAICRSENVLRRILHDEHRTKLAGQVAYLRKHPTGAPTIGVSRDDILKSIATERGIVRDTRPRRCT